MDMNKQQKDYLNSLGGNAEDLTAGQKAQMTKLGGASQPRPTVTPTYDKPNQQTYLQALGVISVDELTPGQKAYLTKLGQNSNLMPPSERKTAAQAVQLEQVDLSKCGIQPVSFNDHVNKQWDRYSILDSELLYDGHGSGYKGVFRNGKLVQIAGDGYKVLPNEEVLELGNQLAASIGAKPFTEFRGKWYGKMGNHALYNKAETQMYALYCQPEPMKVKGVDEVNVGFALNNSIDGSSGFGVSSFTFRFGCGNLVIMSEQRGQQLNRHYTDVLAWASKRHTSGLKVDRPNLQKFILTVLDRSKEVIDLYREMAVKKMNETVAKRIAESNLPQRALPDHIEFKTVNDRRELTKFDQNRTIWDTYNSVTEAIWHNVKSDLGTKVNQFGAINEAVLPVLRA